MKTILSLFDYSGKSSQPYHENGYKVVKIDIKLGIDILTWDYTKIPRNNVYGILAFPPCTDYALSGARWFKEKDSDGRTAYSDKLVRKMMEIINYFDPTFVMIENPMSRIHKLHPDLGSVKFKFHPYEFAGYDPVPSDSEYQKTTWLWGKFNIPEKKVGKNNGNWMFTELGGKSEKTKELRSISPLGFAYAFYEANNLEVKYA